MPLFCEAQLLYGQAETEALSAALQKERRLCTPHFEWDPGWRLLLGGDLPRAGWQWLVRGTRIHTKARSSVTGDLQPLWLRSLSERAERAHALQERWRLHLGFIDGLLRKTWSPPPHTRVGLELLLGLRFALVRQKYKIVYEGAIESLLSAKNKFSGVGPLMGGGIEYRCLSWLALYGKSSLSLLSGSFYLHENAWRQGGHRALNLHGESGGVQPIVDSELGVQGGWRGWSWQLGYEWLLCAAQGAWFRLPALHPRGSDLLRSQGSLSFQGIVAGVGYRF